MSDYNIKKNCDTVLFLKAVKQCKGDVFLCTSEGDYLNLKSRLCQYIFAVATINEDFLDGATLHCQETDDSALLADFIN